MSAVSVMAAVTATGLLPASAANAVPDASSAPAVVAGKGDASPGDGYDISNFQCGAALPASPAFAVLEVEGSPYNRTTSASCLQSQYTYATGTGSAAQFYMYAGDTATRGGSHTITSVCGSSPSAQCVHDYAAGAAEDALASVDAAALPVTPTTWWVDVECSTSTCPDWHVSDGRTDLNQAAVKGYVDGLRTRPDRVASVGFYSTAYQWGRITGQTNGSPAFGVEGLPVWYASAASDVQVGATQFCGTPSFDGGLVTLVQGAPVTVAGGDAIDPDALCQPMIASVTQNAAAGSLITASGVGRPGASLTISLADSFTPARPLATVPTDASGHWSLGFHLSSNGVLTVQDPDGAAQSTGINVVAKVNVSKSRADGKDKLGHCIDRLDGSTFPYVPGSVVDLRGARDKVIGFGYVHKLGTIGSWMATEVVPCGKTPSTTKASISGVIPGTAQRYAADGRTAAIKIPVNKTPVKAVGKTSGKK